LARNQGQPIGGKIEITMQKVLHIEDNLANQILVERVLQSAGYEVVRATDGRTGIQLANETSPDLILIDMGLPDIDGQTVVTMLKQLPSLNDTPMVAITALPPEQAFLTAERYGLSGCILKPIDINRFPDQIADFLEG
jgi:CheY-like chemotaxis protein